MPARPAAGMRTGGPAFACAVKEGAACARYAVEGRTPSVVLLPETEGEAAAALAACNEAGLAVVAWGGGTLQQVGNPPARLDAVLSLERLNRVLTYEPGDLTISVQAGVTLRQLRQTLAAHGQMLPIEVAHADRATIGGLVATNLAGPRRFGAGTYRDLLIGLTVAAPDGTVTKAGGMVVKNVSGYDMVKLHLGALGTLGLLLQLNFKVLTEPARDLTAIVPGDRSALIALAAQLAGSQLTLDSLELLSPEVPSAGERSWRLAARLTGSEQGVTRKRAELIARCAGAAGEVRWLDGVPLRRWWQQYATFLAPAGTDAEALLRLTVPPAGLGAVIARVEGAAQDAGLTYRLAAQAGNGAVTFRLAGSSLRSGVHRVRTALADGTPILLAAPAEVKAGNDVWGPPPAGIDLMTRIKDQFDPRHTLNPGRFVGGL